jgi:pterin-4a-carbinolamine dehydratase
MKCDSQASLLAHTFASPYLGHKPNIAVATQMVDILLETKKMGTFNL